VASDLAPLVNLIQGYIELSAKMSVFSFIFSLGFAIVSNWVGSKNLDSKLSLELLWRGHMRNLLLIIKEAIP
jgi:hypothetical protein